MRSLGLALALSLAFVAPTASAHDSDEPHTHAKKRAKKVDVDENEDVDAEAVEEEEEEESPRRKKKRRPSKKVIPAQPGEEPPEGYYKDTKNTPAMWGPGVGLLVGGWVLSSSMSLFAWLVDSCVSTCATNGREWGWGVLPVAGPFVITADSDFDTGWRVTYAVFGVMQNAGLALIIAGATVKREVWVREAEVQPELIVGPGNVGVRVRF